MKKFGLILILFVISLAGFSQDKTIAFSDNITYAKVPFTAADTITQRDTLFSVVFLSNQHYTLTQDMQVKITKVSGNPRVNVVLQAKKFDADAYTTITSKLWYGGGGTDTTITLSNATANRYRIYRVYFDANLTAQKSLISNLEFKVYRE
jgi:hypothetical protein